ncbi:type I polyketide synthase [Streptomyces sp. S4.7]|uniref:type I polyketide synthase n=1 Tax=Streptomyces sp. S4.7 TaxID=2705439 RepID=UPI0023B3492B|nr:type I polyketide synthase [Streptomyces sp. S4.7]
MLALVFPGQGSQRRGMGAQLFEAFPELVVQADEILGYSIETLCRENPDGNLEKTQYTQPTLYVVNALSYFEHLNSSGEIPDFLAGHSLGEYNALLAAGVFDFATGLRVVQKRGELMSRVNDGGMAAVVGLDADRVAEVLAGPGLESLSVANYNNPAQIVIAGPRDRIEAARSAFEGAGAGLYTVLRVGGAFHSPHMAGVQEEFAEFLGGVELAAPTVPVLSNVTARPHGPDVTDLMVSQLTRPVLWTDSVRHLIDQGVEDIRQIGPGRALIGLVQATQRDAAERRAQEPSTAEDRADTTPTPAQPATTLSANPTPDTTATATPTAETAGERIRTLRLRRPARDRAQGGTDHTEEQLTALLLADLRTIVTRVLTADPGALRAETELSALGFDSIKLIEFADQLREEFGVDLTPSVFFEYFTIGAFTAHLLAEHRDTVVARYRDGAAGGAEQTPPAPAEAAGRARSGAVPAPRDGATAAAGGAQPAAGTGSDAVAIVGVSAVLPGSADLDEFWRHLVDGTELVTDTPADRWRSWAGPERAPGVRGALIKDFDTFDCRFFGISPGEAELMDPHQRIFLQTVWKAFEDAGRRPTELAGTRTGLFVGHGSMDYVEVLAHSAAGTQSHTATGLAHSILPNRISHQLDLRGPSESVDTACSSSLVALHRAVRSLREGECDLAVAGGASILMSPTPFDSFQQAGMLAPDGRCKTFDRAADGYVRGEGVVAVVLKPLDKALADGDHVYAVVRGSAVNHGGRSASLTAPSPDAQADLIATAWRRSGLDPATATYIETHGTGTSLGDPIEIEGLKKAFATLHRDWGHTERAEPHIGLGSVKTSIGHLEAAAGLAGVVKMLLALRHERLPALRHFGELNPFIRMDGSPFRIVDRTEAWPRLTDGEGAPVPRRCGVSSFGFGGTNAHVVLEEFIAAPAPDEAADPAAGPYLVPLSARTPGALREYADAVVRWLDEHAPENGAPAFDLSALADTLQLGRDAMDERLALVVADTDDLYDGLVRYLRGEDADTAWYAGNAAGAGALSGVLLSDAEGAAYLQALLDRGATDKLARLWAAGADLDWRELRGDRPVRRTPLPTYPFERRRCWPQDLVPRQAVTPAGAVPVPHAGVPAPVPAAPVTDEQVGAHLAAVFAETLKWRPEEVDPGVAFDELGLNSLVIEQLRRRLVAHYGPIDSTTFYVYKNLADLTRYVAGKARAEGLTLPAVGGQGTALAPAPAAVPAPAVAPAPAAVPAPARPVSTPVSAAAGTGGGDIAIIGMSGRYPKASSLADYWSNLLDGRDCVGEIPMDRPGYRRYAELARERYGDKWYRWGGFLDDVDAFDPQFFQISPREARALDPQERLFLETAWETLEDAGHTRKSLADPTAGDARGSVGVFAGVTFNNYQMFAANDLEHGQWQPISSQTFSIANRVSYLFNLGGPSLTVDTACSSSLYAIHLAVASIRRGECETALAGGVNLSLHPSKYMMLAEAGFLAEDGRCRAFGDGGTGYVPAEAVGAVLLKPLERALADGDQVYAVIKGSAVNSDGHTFGYSVPNPVAQSELITAALADAGVGAETISYVEAHGTGTSLGDPIEIRGLTDAFAASTDARQFCAIGSVKSGIGHAEAAAGIAQVTKVALQMRHGELVPSLLHSATTNSNLELDRTPFKVQRERTPWERPRTTGPAGDELVHPRRAGISSFGAGGVNVHLVLEEAPAVATPPAPARDLVFPLSAREPETLRDLAARMAGHLRSRPAGAIRVADVAHTLQSGREPMEHRAAFVADDLPGILKGLDEIAAPTGGPSSVSTGHREPRSTPPPLADGASPSEVASAWVAGAAPDWAAHLRGLSPRRVSLPTYPFARRRYWMAEAGPTAQAPTTAPPVTAPPAVAAAAADVRPGDAGETLLNRLAGLPEGERNPALASYLQTELGRLLEFPPDAPPDRRRGFFDLGMDSVMSVRLGNTLEELLGIELYTSVTFDYPCVDDLTGFLLEQLDLDTPEPAAQSVTPTRVGTAPVQRTVHYRVDWEPAAGPPRNDARLTGSVLVFDPDGRLSELAREHAGDDARIVTVRTGDTFAGSADSYRIRRENDEDYATLLAALGTTPTTVIHAWPGPEAGLTSVFRLTQALMRGRVSRPLRLLRVETFSGEHPDAMAEAFGGFARSVRHENPNLVYQALTVAVTDDPPADVLRACVGELAFDDAAEAEVRHDRAGRWTRRLRELAPATGTPKVAVRDGGTYVITGGGGGLGLIFAEHLAQQSRVRLLLLGRSELDATRREALDRIRSLGSEVVYESVDVSDAAEVTRVLDETRSRWGRLHGVIHSAGVLRDALILNKSADEIGTVLSAKVDGARALDEATRLDELDFFMTFSSLAALAGNPGQVDYAFASRFLNAFSRGRERQRAQGERSGASITVVWPFWRDGGMRVDAETGGFVRRRLGLEHLPTDAGVEAFDIALRTAEPEIGVVLADREKLDRVLRIERPEESPDDISSSRTTAVELLDTLEELGL